MCAHVHICSIAIVYKKQGKYPEALELYHKSLATKEKVLGCEHLEPAKTKVNIGIVCKSMGEYEKALNTYNEALPVLESTLGCDHPLVAATMVL